MIYCPQKSDGLILYEASAIAVVLVLLMAGNYKKNVKVKWPPMSE